MKMGTIYSWEIISEKIVIKNGDKTFVEAGETGIPREIYWFFECDYLGDGESKSVKLNYKGSDYVGTIRKKQDGVGRINLSWRGDLHDLLKNIYKDLTTFPSMRFQKIGSDRFVLSFVEDSLILSDDNTPSESEEISSCKEGKKKVVYTTKYERNPQIRRMAIMIHGVKCEVCGFDFEKIYGEVGKDYIEVHHKKPLSSIGEECEVDPDKDMACLCSNCHRMIHRKRDKVLTVEELEKLLNS